MGPVLLSALALVLVFEGLMPLLAPRRWRAVVEKVLQMSDGQIRFLGLCGIGLGLLLLLLFAGPG
jgi:hypothetical protein